MSHPQTVIRVPYKHVNGVGIPTDIHFSAEALAASRRQQAPVLLIFHGGGFTVGEASMNNRDQIQDCSDRGWMVLSAEYRLCPGVNVLDGPMTDARDLLNWAQTGGLEDALRGSGQSVLPDPKRVMAMGTSSGGHLALTLAWDVSNPPIAILDFYGPTNFSDRFWTQPIPQIQSKLPNVIPKNLFERVCKDTTIFTGGMSLEGQSEKRSDGPPKPNFEDPRVLLLFSSIGNGKMLDLMWPSYPNGQDRIDPYHNVNHSWPATAIVHGTADFMVPIHLSRQLHERLTRMSIPTKLFEVEGEPHTFVGMMKKGSRTWDQQRKGFDFLAEVLQQTYDETPCA
ncbi:alpha/beta-hydrolase [Myriangium duriaei CBS 260.36]|uniref:Alpha/beta-hydrolase n=1 Tax=Myriangium duriaei CBS 260.36 TaxID=1168546 RepID=A0A9P4MES2_9PEZI|nr:alpha/beta-hydrolase [Myriangium duriaei CBS 260.36]